MSDNSLRFDPTGVTSKSPCLITGATGFLGSHLARRLIQERIPVRLVVRDPKRAGAFSSAAGVQILTGDLKDEAHINKAVQGAAYVFHCAAKVADWGTPKAFIDINVTATRRLTEACLLHGVRRLVHVSSTDVYGYPSRVESTMAVRPCGVLYSDTKLEGENAISEGERKGLPAAIIRPATIYGPGSYSIVKEFVDVLRQHRMFFIGGGRSNAGLCYVENVVDALLLAAQHPKALGQAYNITDDLATTWKDFIRALASIIDYPAPRVSLPFSIAYGLGWTMEHLQSAKSTHRPLFTRMAANLLGKSQGFSYRESAEGTRLPAAHRF